MTGFGVGGALLGAGRIVADVRAVNGRLLEVRVRMPRELAELSGHVDAAVRSRLARGRCEVAVRTEGAIFPSPALDKERAKAAYRALLELRDELAPGADVPFSMLSTVPDLFTPPVGRNQEEMERAVTAAVAAALDQLEDMRDKEGKALEEDLRCRLLHVAELATALRTRAAEVLETYTKRLHERLGRLLVVVQGAETPSLPIDPARLDQELVMLADRCDITEELTRLEIHATQMKDYLTRDGPVGRRLDFLLQEMAREINTIGAKSQDTMVAHAVVELKTEVERMREQVQNVE